MNFITLLLSCHSSNEHYEGCNMTVAYVKRADLVQIQRRVAIAERAKRRDQSFVDACYWADADFVNINAQTLNRIERNAREVARDMVILVGDNDLSWLGTVRTDCVRMHVGVDGNIRWMAYDHHSSDELTTESVPISKLAELLRPADKQKKGGP